jgi:hypothetical protein
MQTQLTKSGAKWAIECSGGPDEGTVSKEFASQEAAEKWRRDVTLGNIEAPDLNTKPKRNRKPSGKFKGDNPKTPNKNEAWVGGKTPKKKAKTKKKAPAKKK